MGFPPGTFQGFLTQRSSWKRLIDYIRDVAWIVDGVPPGHGAAAPRVEAGPDPSVNVGDLGGADALTTAPVKGAGAAATPTTSVDVAKRLANVAIKTTTSVAPGMSVAQGPRHRRDAAVEGRQRQSGMVKNGRGRAVHRAVVAVTPKTTLRFRHRTGLPIPVATVS